MDNDTAAAKRFWRLVRDFSTQAKAHTIGVMFVDTMPADRLDLSKISQRVYGNRYEVLAIQAAAGLDKVTQPLTQRQLALPTPAKLMQLKRQAGFESIPAMRRAGEPAWKV